MKFDEFLNKAWDDHATKAEQVAERLNDGIALIETNDQIPQLSHLMTHVYGEHLGQWQRGVESLEKLKQVASFQKNSESEKAIHRSIASLELSSEKIKSLSNFSVSDQIRILAVTASALREQKKPEQAQKFFREALEKAQTGIDKSDPANRALAVTGNNLACALEEKNQRTSKDVELMILAAETGRKYWEIAGTWNQVTWAEYRLAMTYLKVENFVQALKHAQTCLEIAEENGSPALEMFFGYEALALVEKSRTNSIGFSKAVEQAKAYFEKLEDKDKSWCLPILQKIEK